MYSGTLKSIYLRVKEEPSDQVRTGLECG